MFDQILQLVKENLGGNPAINSSIPAGSEADVHNEVATQITNGLQQHAASQGGGNSWLTALENGIGNESPITSAISGGLVGSLASKFGLPAAATGAITAMLPGILQKFASKSGSSVGI